MASSSGQTGESAGQSAEKEDYSDFIEFEMDCIPPEECEKENVQPKRLKGLAERTAKERSPAAHGVKVTTGNDIHEYDVDINECWSLSSGSSSYTSAWSMDTQLDGALCDAEKVVLRTAPIKEFAQKKAFVTDGAPPILKINVNELFKLNQMVLVRRRAAQKRIIVPCEIGKESERRELVVKLCDDVFSEYFSSSGKFKKKLDLTIDCGGDLPPRVIIAGSPYETEDIKYSIYRGSTDGKSEIESLDGSESSYDKGNLGSDVSQFVTRPVEFPVVPSFSKCSIEEHAKRVQRPHLFSLRGFFGRLFGCR